MISPQPSLLVVDCCCLPSTYLTFPYKYIFQHVFPTLQLSYHKAPDPASSSGGVILKSHHYSDREPWSCLEGREQSDYDLHWECRDTNKPAVSYAPVENKVSPVCNMSPEDNAPFDNTALLESGAQREDSVPRDRYVRSEGSDPSLTSSVPFEDPVSPVKRSAYHENSGPPESDVPSEGSVLFVDNFPHQSNVPSKSTFAPLKGNAPAGDSNTPLKDDAPAGDRNSPLEDNVTSISDEERARITTASEESNGSSTESSGPSKLTDVSSQRKDVPYIEGSVPTNDSNTPSKCSHVAHASTADGVSVATSHRRPLDERAVWITQTLRAGRDHNLLKFSDVRVARTAAIGSSVERCGDRFREQPAEGSTKLPSKRQEKGSSRQFTERPVRIIAGRSAKQSTEFPVRRFTEPSAVKSPKEPTEALNKSMGLRASPGTRLPGKVVRKGSIRHKGRRCISRESSSSFAKVSKIDREDWAGLKARMKGSGARVNERVRVTTYELVIQAYKETLREVCVCLSRALLCVLYFYPPDTIACNIFLALSFPHEVNLFSIRYRWLTTSPVQVMCTEMTKSHCKYNHVSGYYVFVISTPSLAEAMQQGPAMSYSMSLSIKRIWANPRYFGVPPVLFQPFPSFTHVYLVTVGGFFGDHFIDVPKEFQRSVFFYQRSCWGRKYFVDRTVPGTRYCFLSAMRLRCFVRR